MAKKSGIIAGAKPAAATPEVLYGTYVNQHASAVLNIANDGTASTYSVGLKRYDQKLVYGPVANQPFTGLFFHEGDVLTIHQFQLDQTVNQNSGFIYGGLLKNQDDEKEAFFDGFVIPLLTTIHVKDVPLTTVTLTSTTGTFDSGETVTAGVAPDDTTALIYDVEVVGANTILYVGPRTINGAGADFFDGDVLEATGGATGTVAGGGVGTAEQTFVFSTNGAAGLYEAYVSGPLVVLNDRTYRFDVSDSSMTGRDFRISRDVNGVWGPDNTFGTADDGVEFTENRTVNGTAGSAGAWVQYGFTDEMALGALYFYDGGTGTASNSDYGGIERYLELSDQYEYDSIYVYDLHYVGNPWTNNVDTIKVNDIVYTVIGQSGFKWGTVRDAHHGMHIEVILGEHSLPFVAGDIVYDNPYIGHPAPVEITSVEVDVTDIPDYAYLVKDKTLGANATDRITSVVIGPGDRIVVESATQNNIFTLVGFIDDDDSLPLRNGYDHLSEHLH